MVLHTRLRNLREEMQITQRELAAALNVNPTIVSKWELGHKRPVYEDLISLAKHFECSADYLLGIEDDF